MKPTSKEILEAVSKHCSNQLTLHKFNKGTLLINDKYRKGRLTGLHYIGELTFHFIQEEKRIQQQFREEILNQMKLYSCLEETEYKRGLYDALNDILNHMRDAK